MPNVCKYREVAFCLQIIIDVAKGQKGISFFSLSCV